MKPHRAQIASAALAAALFSACVPDFSGFSIVDADPPSDAALVDGDSGPGPIDAGSVDSGSRDFDGGGFDGGDFDGGGFDGGDFDAGDIGPVASCRPIPLPCLDASDPSVIEIPTEAGAEAFDTATAGQTIQIRGLRIVGIQWVPALVTLRGCAGASIEGNVGFRGTGGVVEGFQVSGRIVANNTGAYVVRDNDFADQEDTGTSVLAGEATNALVSGSIELIVERNRFHRLERAVSATTRYDTMTHEVTLRVRNNLFEDVRQPIVISEGGLVGEINATVEHNTFYDFDTAIRLLDVAQRTAVRANLLALGDTGVSSNSVYDGPYNMHWDLTTPHTVAPFSGTFTAIPASFVSGTTGDLRLRPGSLAIDAVPDSTLSEDYLGCLRPVAFGGGSPRADVGAHEAVP